MKIHNILQNGYYGGEFDVPDDTQGIPLWYTRTSPPYIPNGYWATWEGTSWVLTQQPPPVESDAVDTP